MAQLLIAGCTFSATADPTASPSPTPTASGGPCTEPVIDAEVQVPVPPPPTEAGLLPQLPSVSDRTGWSWGPERPAFTYCTPAGYATINSIVEDDRDERGFYFLRARGSDDQLRNVNLQDGGAYRATVYFWNDVAENKTDGETEAATLRLDLPKSVTNIGHTRADICATDTKPTCVWTALALYTENDETLELSVRPGSARMTIGGRTHAIADEDLTGEDGILLGCDGFTGVLDGSGECIGHINFTLDVHKPDSQLWVTTAGDTFDNRIRPGSKIIVSVTYRHERGLSPAPLYLAVRLPRAITVDARAVSLSASDSTDLVWTEWTTHDATYREAPGNLSVKVPDDLYQYSVIHLSATLIARTGAEFDCGGAWAEIVGSVSDDGVVQIASDILTIEAMC